MATWPNILAFSPKHIPFAFPHGSLHSCAYIIYLFVLVHLVAPFHYCLFVITALLRETSRSCGTMVRSSMSSYFVPFTYLLASGFLFSAVSAGPEPVHDISDPKFRASAFVQHNLSSTAVNLPAGSIESTSVALLPGVKGLGITTVIFTLKQGGYATPHWHPRYASPEPPNS